MNAFAFSFKFYAIKDCVPQELLEEITVLRIKDYKSFII